MGSLSHVWAVCVTHTGVTSATSRFLSTLEQHGATRDERDGTSDVALSRNAAYTDVINQANKVGKSVLLCVDDDIVARLSAVEMLCAWPRANAPEHPVRSGVYVNREGVVAASRYDHGRYLTGLGLLAVRLPHLLGLAQELKTVRTGAGKLVVPFCTSGPISDQWYPDDYSFTARLGGAWLDPGCVAQHQKVTTLVPSETTLEHIRRGTLDCRIPGYEVV